MNKHFGKISAFLCLMLYITANYLGWNLINFANNISVNITFVVVLCIILFVWMCCFFQKAMIWVYKILFFLMLMIVNLIVLNSFETSLKQDFENGKISMVDMNASLTLGRVFLILVLLIVFVIVGSIFDYVVSRKIIKNQKMR